MDESSGEREGDASSRGWTRRVSQTEGQGWQGGVAATTAGSAGRRARGGRRTGERRRAPVSRKTRSGGGRGGVLKGGGVRPSSRAEPVPQRDGAMRVPRPHSAHCEAVPATPGRVGARARRYVRPWAWSRGKRARAGGVARGVCDPGDPTGNTPFLWGHDRFTAGGWVCMYPRAARGGPHESRLSPCPVTTHALRSLESDAGVSESLGESRPRDVCRRLARRTIRAAWTTRASERGARFSARGHVASHPPSPPSP